jgi:spore germination protein KB
MIEKGKISAFQMSFTMLPVIVSTVILTVPSVTVKYAGRDAWLSPIWASAIGLVAVFVACRLHQMYPGQTPIEYAESILGRIPGKIAGLLFLLFYLHIDGIVFREYEEFVVGTFLTRTPMFAVIIPMVLLCAYAVYNGLEVIARSAQIVIPVLLVFFFLMALLLIKDMKISHLLPMFENGLKASLWGSVVPQSWFSEYFLISFMLPYLFDREKAVKWGIVSVAGTAAVMVLSNIVALLVFGKLTSTFVYPVITAIRYISIAEFFEHLESIVMAIWVTGTFIKISVFYYAISLGAAQWLKLGDYRPLVLPIGFLLALLGYWCAPDFPSLAKYLFTTNVFYMMVVQLLLPIGLLLIAQARQLWRKNRR